MQKSSIAKSGDDMLHMHKEKKDLRDNDQHAGIERKIVHSVVNEVVAHAVFQVAHFGHVELFETLVERNLHQNT